MQTVPVEDRVTFKNVDFPEGVNLRQLVITGPPGSGKSTLVEQIGGWPEEGNLDLGKKNWWRERLLTFRPREIHFVIPFRHHAESLAVFDADWLDMPSAIDFERIMLPPAEKSLLRTDWREKYVFDFQLPDPEIIYQARLKRTGHGTHPVDVKLSLDIVRRQVDVYSKLAVFFHREGLKVIVRTAFQGPPHQVAES